jgi:hypothetical protein
MNQIRVNENSGDQCPNAALLKILKAENEVLLNESGVRNPAIKADENAN